MKILFLLLLPLLGMAADHEFLTPQVLVLKNPKPYKYTSSSIKKMGSWKKENALLRDKQGKILRKPDITFFTYIVFDKPLKHKEKVDISGMTLQYDAEKASSIFKLNQVGNGAAQKKKYAYIGAWLGTLGALPLKHLDGKTFELRRAADNKCVYKNTLRLRKSDPEYQNEIPFSGEEVLELDYSKFNTPGTYYLYVSGVGRSMNFAIGSKAISEAFYIHARGLYHKRCGIAKAQPFTVWAAPACHSTVIRGRFPGNAEHYRKGKGEKEFGFFDRKGNRIDVKHFDLIKQNLPYKNEPVSAPGGWHDAADYDRRPYHLRIVSDLAALYLMKPENFIDGQLNIPESGNGIPDILDEAAWGVKHLLAVQQADGAVGTWFETTGHPQPGEGLPDGERRIYYISAPCRNGTLEYAAAVSTLALAMKKAGAHKQAQIYQQSAEKAWNFASDPRNRHVAAYQYNGKVIFYREEKELNLEHLIRYAATRYLLSGDDNARQMLLQNSQAALQEFNKNFRKWSPLSWMMLSETGCENMASRYRKVILNNADKMISEQENAYPYRTLWYAHNAGWVHSMAWGNYHPLRRALTLIAAHKLTGEEKYLDAAYLANDFHNGANPLGRSMTSGLGRVYPAVFLDLVSYADGIGEFVPGITPYGNTFGIDRNAVKLVYGKSAGKLPIFRRHVNLEFLSVPSSEYSVWETIAPAVVTTGYLLEKPHLPERKWKKRHPADDFRKLPGYRALP